MSKMAGSSMRVLVTGAAGFIGSHLCDRLLARGDQVWGIDNFHLGRDRNIAHLASATDFRFERLDCLDAAGLHRLFAAATFDAVFHLAANSDIAQGNSDRALDLRLNQLTTTHVLEAMHIHRVGRLFFSSTSAVFGEQERPLSEDDGPLQPISFYGASKLAAEAYVSVYAHTLGIRSLVFRFPNVVGERATHGAIYDFIDKLKRNSAELPVLGDGRQTKPYLYVSDLIDAIVLAWEKSSGALDVFNAAGSGATSVKDIAEIVVSRFGRPDTRIAYAGGDRGWPGDVPRFRYDTAKLRGLGWAPKFESTAAVRHTVERIAQNGF
jgi:UDP-glucose 4-epimerase